MKSCFVAVVGVVGVVGGVVVNAVLLFSVVGSAVASCFCCCP